MTTVNAPLYRTATGKRLHLQECPHVHGAEVLPASPQNLDTLDVCTWCKAELAGEGRTPHDTIEDALRDMGVAEHCLPELTRHLRTVEHDSVYVPFSRSYVALGRDGLAVAWAGKTYVGFRDRPTIVLPDFVSTGGSRAERPDSWGVVCPVCFLQRSVNGTCAGCW